MIVALLAACSEDSVDGPQRATDMFAQAPGGGIDVLLVVSEAPSAASARAALGAGIGAFQEALDATPTWQLGVVSARLDYSDPDRGALLGDPPILGPGDDLAALLPSRLPAGAEDGEQGLSAALVALGPTMTLAGGPNEGFLRPEADLLVVFVSAQDDSGTLVVTDFVTELREVKEEREPLAAGFVLPVTRYQTAVRLLGGPVSDPAAADWSDALGELGATAAAAPIADAFRLSMGARSGTLDVRVDDLAVPEDAAEGWTYDPAGWWLTFHGDAVPARGASIEVSYVVDPRAVAPSDP